MTGREHDGRWERFGTESNAISALLEPRPCRNVRDAITSESDASAASERCQRFRDSRPDDSDLDRYLAEHDRRIHDELFDLLRIPSVSARSEHAADVRRAAEWVRDSLDADRLRRRSSTRRRATRSCLAEWRKAPGAPTVLVYGHYDVQPAEPLELWESPPFEPTIRDGSIYARGSVDDKGQLFLHVKALEAHLAVRGKLPVNVIVLAEGEEEVGSENLEQFIDANAKRLAARRRRDLRLVDVRAGAAVDSLVAARARVLPDRRRRARRSTCTRGVTAARW